MMNVKMAFRKWNRARINASRNLVLNIVIFLFDSVRNTRATCKEQDAILVLRSDGKVGDTIISTGFFRELRRLNPDSEIFVLGNKNVQNILTPLKVIDEMIIYRKGLLSTLKTFLKLRGKNYKFILNSTDELKPHAAFLMGSLKAHQKLIFRSSQLKSVTKTIDYQAGQFHFSFLYENTLQYLYGEGFYDISYQVAIRDDISKRVHDLLAAKEVAGKQIIAFNAFAGPKLRSFSYETSIQFISYLLTDPSRVVVTLASPKDLSTVVHWKLKSLGILNQEQLSRWIILEDLQTMEETFAVMSLADLVISPDTSIVHGACALNKKLICVYRQSGDYQNSLQWGPRGNKEETIVLHAKSLPPKVWDMNDILFEDMKEAIDKISLQALLNSHSESLETVTF